MRVSLSSHACNKLWVGVKTNLEEFIARVSFVSPGCVRVQPRITRRERTEAGWGVEVEIRKLMVTQTQRGRIANLKDNNENNDCFKSAILYALPLLEKKSFRRLSACCGQMSPKGNRRRLRTGQSITYNWAITWNSCFPWITSLWALWTVASHWYLIISFS